MFNAILDKHQVTDSNSFVDFVEKVEYVQGLYPDDPKTMWDASKLKKQLEQTKVAKKTYTVKDGDTIYGIAVANGLTEKQFMALNPDIGEYIHTGDVLTVANEVNYVRVKVMKTETRKVEVDYDVEKTNDASMFKGTHRRAHMSARLTAGEPCAVTATSTQALISLFPAAVRRER